MSHTQGPWAVSGVRMKLDRQSAHSVIWYDEEKKRDEQICAVWYDPKTHLGFADARLISAAPDLLEALQYARRFLKASDHDVAFVDAAISKAIGAA